MADTPFPTLWAEAVLADQHYSLVEAETTNATLLGLPRTEGGLIRLQ